MATTTKRPGLTVTLPIFLIGFFCGATAFFVLNDFDQFQKGQPTIGAAGFALDGEFCKVALAFAAFIIPIVFLSGLSLDGLRERMGGLATSVSSAVKTPIHGSPSLAPAVGGVSRAEFDALAAKVSALEGKPVQPGPVAVAPVAVQPVAVVPVVAAPVPSA